MNFRKEFDKAIAKGSVFVTFDPTVVGVRIPSYLKQMDSMTVVTLTFGKELSIPIPDLSITDDYVSGSLHFPTLGSKFLCIVPWKAVVRIDEGRPNPVLAKVINLAEYREKRRNHA